MDEPTTTDSPQDTGTATEIPDEVSQLFDQADLMAILQTHRRALDAHRRELILMWIAVLCCAGALTYLTVKNARTVLEDLDA